MDWPGHGESGTPSKDFGDTDLVDAAKAVIQKSGSQSVIPISTAHAGWVAIELRHQLGERIEKLGCCWIGWSWSHQRHLWKD